MVKKASRVKKAPFDDKALEQVLKNQALAFLKLPNVRSVGIGYKRTGIRTSKSPCIIFSVDEKLSGSAIGKAGSLAIPRFFKDEAGRKIPTDIVVRKFQLSYQVIPLPTSAAQGASSADPAAFRRTRQDPLVPGISISHARGTAGTLGAIVYDLESGDPMALSNWHVLQGPEGEIGDRVAQPGRGDNSNVAGNDIGQVVRSHLGRAGDCAVASINRPYLTGIFQLDETPTRIARVGVDDPVRKSGRTTGVTCGKVSQVSLMLKMNYGGRVGEVYVKGFEIKADGRNTPPGRELSMPGDSGSLWMINDPQEPGIAVGLHLSSAAEAGLSSEFAQACYIDSVLEKLQVTFQRPAPPGP